MAALSHNLSKPRQALLQILIAKHVMTETEAQAAADDIEKHLKEGSVGDLNEAFQDMNAALKVMNFEVRSMQENGSLVHTMVNLTDDELSAKHGTRMNPADMEVFKKAIKAIGASDDDAESQVVHYDKFDRAQQRTLQTLVAHKWLHLDGTSITVAARARLELPEFLEANNITRSQVIYH